MGQVTKVIVLPQTHYRPEDTKHEQTYRTWLLNYQARSQYNILRAVTEHKNAVVFSEGITDTYTPRVYELMRRKGFSQMRLAGKLFISGAIPLSFNLLTMAQKRFLVRTGAARTLFLLGKVKALQKTEDRLKTKRANKEYSDLKTLFGDYARCIAMTPGTEMYSSLISGREKTAIAHIRAFVSGGTRIHGSIYLVFGAAHNFLKYNAAGSRLAFAVHPRFVGSFRAAQQRTIKLRNQCNKKTEEILDGLIRFLFGLIQYALK